LLLFTDSIYYCVEDLMELQRRRSLVGKRTIIVSCEHDYSDLVAGTHSLPALFPDFIPRDEGTLEKSKDSAGDWKINILLKGNKHRYEHGTLNDTSNSSFMNIINKYMVVSSAGTYKVSVFELKRTVQKVPLKTSVPVKVTTGSAKSVPSQKAVREPPHAGSTKSTQKSCDSSTQTDQTAQHSGEVRENVVKCSPKQKTADKINQQIDDHYIDWVVGNSIQENNVSHRAEGTICEAEPSDDLLPGDDDELARCLVFCYLLIRFLANTDLDYSSWVDGIVETNSDSSASTDATTFLTNDDNMSTITDFTSFESISSEATTSNIDSGHEEEEQETPTYPKPCLSRSAVSVLAAYDKLKEMNIDPNDLVFAGPVGIYVGPGADLKAGPGSVGIPISIGMVLHRAGLINQETKVSTQVRQAIIGEVIRSKFKEETVLSMSLVSTVPVWICFAAPHHLLHFGLSTHTSQQLIIDAEWSLRWQCKHRFDPVKIGMLWEKFRRDNWFAPSKPLCEVDQAVLHKHFPRTCYGLTDLKMPDNLIMCTSRSECSRELVRQYEAHSGSVNVAVVDMSKSSCFDLLPCAEYHRGYTYQIGPSFAQRPTAFCPCPKHAARAFIGRQLGTKGLDYSQQRYETQEDIFLAFEANVNVAFHDEGRQDLKHSSLQTFEEWISTYHGNMKTKFYQEKEVVDLQIRSITSDVEIIPKLELCGIVLPGADYPAKVKDPRAISNRNVAFKLGCVGITATLGKLTSSLFAEYGPYYKPEAIAEDLSNHKVVVNNDLIGLSCLTMDYSRFDGHTTQLTKNTVVRCYELLGNVFQSLIAESLDGNERWYEFLQLLQTRKFTTCKVAGSKGSLLSDYAGKWTFHILGSVASGDMDTTLGNTILNMSVYLTALSRSNLTRDRFFARFTGDDGLVVGPNADIDALRLQMVAVSTEIGHNLDVQRNYLSEPGTAPQFCSRWLLPVLHGDRIVFKSMRAPGRVLMRLGHTVTRCPNQAYRNGLLKSKCLSELAWCRDVPVVKSMAAAILSRPEVLSANIRFDNDTEYKMAEDLGLGSDATYWSEDVRGRRRKLSELAKRISVEEMNTSDEIRRAYHYCFGVSPEEQLAMEDYLRRTCVHNLAELDDTMFANLLDERFC
jgi:hypothetical protein